jgi:long-chain fatty acid transport protein
MRRTAVVTAAALVAAIGLSASRAMAQGFSVYEHDACAMGRSGAGVASPCLGGSAIFFNPAGLVTGEAGRWNVVVGATLIPPRGSFVPDGGGAATDLAKNNIPVPNLYLTRQIGTRFAVGFGVFAPYGLTTEWPNTFAGRFLSYKATLQSIYMQPTLAFRVSPRIQVGAGLDIIRTSVELHQRVDLSSVVVTGTAFTFNQLLGVPVGTDFADARIHGSATSYAAHFGIKAQLTDMIGVGARYLTGVTVKGSGYAGFTQVATGIRLAAGNPLGLPANTPLDAVVAGQFAATGSLRTQTVAASIALPAQFVAGVDLKLKPGLHLFGDVEWTQWSKFATLPLTFGVLPADTLYEGYSNTIGWRAALEYEVSPKFTVRGGFLTHPAAAPSTNVTPLLPEAGRFEGIIGAGYQLNAGIRVDAAFQVIKQQDRRGRIIDYKPGDPDPNSGTYKFSASLFGLGFTFAF